MNNDINVCTLKLKLNFKMTFGNRKEQLKIGSNPESRLSRHAFG